MFCSNCGIEIPKDALFCPECGAKIESDVTDAKGEISSQDFVTHPEGERLEEEQTIIREDSGNLFVPTEDETQQKDVGQKDKGKDKNKIYLLISIIVVVLVGGGMIAHSVLNKKADTEKKTAEAVEEEVPEEVQDTEEIAADIDGVANQDCVLYGSVCSVTRNGMKGNALELENTQSIRVYDYTEDSEKFMDEVDYVYIDDTELSIDITAYVEREVQVMGSLYAENDIVYMLLRDIETTDGPLYDAAEGGIHRYEFIVQDCGWSDAYQASIQRGGYLVRINSEEEYDYILGRISDLGMSSVHFYLGGRRDSNDTAYYWVDENNVVYGEMLNNNSSIWCNGVWMAGEPSYEDPNLQIDEAYLNIFYYSKEGRWVWSDGPENIPYAVPQFSGKVGYIIEYED